jgi:hypothetical protein
MFIVQKSRFADKETMGDIKLVDAALQNLFELPSKFKAA